VGGGGGGGGGGRKEPDAAVGIDICGSDGSVSGPQL